MTATKLHAGATEVVDEHAGHLMAPAAFPRVPVPHPSQETGMVGARRAPRVAAGAQRAHVVPPRGEHLLVRDAPLRAMAVVHQEIRGRADLAVGIGRVDVAHAGEMFVILACRGVGLTSISLALMRRAYSGLGVNRGS